MNARMAWSLAILVALLAFAFWAGKQVGGRQGGA